jgi:hypothetical protein
MVIMFAAPPAAAASAVPLLRHCLALLRSDMLLLRQVGGSGLWLLMAQMAAGRSAGSDALLAELKQVLLVLRIEYVVPTNVCTHEQCRLANHTGLHQHAPLVSYVLLVGACFGCV